MAPQQSLLTLRSRAPRRIREVASFLHARPVTCFYPLYRY